MSPLFTCSHKLHSLAFFYGRRHRLWYRVTLTPPPPPKFCVCPNPSNLMYFCLSQVITLRTFQSNSTSQPYNLVLSHASPLVLVSTSRPLLCAQNYCRIPLSISSIFLLLCSFSPPPYCVFEIMEGMDPEIHPLSLPSAGCPSQSPPFTSCCYGQDGSGDQSLTPILCVIVVTCDAILHCP